MTGMSGCADAVYEERDNEPLLYRENTANNQTGRYTGYDESTQMNGRRRHRWPWCTAFPNRAFLPFCHNRVGSDLGTVECLRFCLRGKLSNEDWAWIYQRLRESRLARCQ